MKQQNRQQHHRQQLNQSPRDQQQLEQQFKQLKVLNQAIRQRKQLHIEQVTEFDIIYLTYCSYCHVNVFVSSIEEHVRN